MAWLNNFRIVWKVAITVAILGMASFHPDGIFGKFAHRDRREDGEAFLRSGFSRRYRLLECEVCRWFSRGDGIDRSRGKLAG